MLNPSIVTEQRFLAFAGDAIEKLTARSIGATVSTY